MLPVPKTNKQTKTPAYANTRTEKKKPKRIANSNQPRNQ